MNKLNFLTNFRKEYPKHYVKMIKNHHKEYYINSLKFCNENNLNLDNDSKRLYHYAFDLKQIPKCLECKNEISSFSVNGNYGYNIFCSKSCAGKNEHNIVKRVKNRKNTSIKTLNDKKNIIISKECNISKDDFIKFIKNESIEISNAEIILISKYPDYYNFYIKNYNIPLQEVIFLIKNEIEKPICSDCETPYRFISYNKGYSNCSNSTCYSKKQSYTKRIKYFPIWINRLKSKNIDTNSNIDIFISNGELDLKCNNCNFEFKRKVHTTIHAGCPKCSISRPQQEIKEFIENLGINVIFNDRKLIKPLELDIVCPDKNIAFEYCGLFWHSEGLNEHIDKLSHYKKYEKCKNNNITLYTIFENEWIFDKELILSKIKSKLGFFDRKIRASDCYINTLDVKDCSIFMNENHLQGNCNSKIKYGLFTKTNELVSAMTFSKKNDVWEMIRFCNKRDYKIHGAASKLFNKFVLDVNPNIVKTFSDLRWGSGDSYKNLNFNLSHISKPNYFYYKKNEKFPKLFSRVNFQKHKLKNKLERFDSTKTEHQNMYENGYRCIWDCGNSVWIWNRT